MITKDVRKLVKAMKAIVCHEGAFVPGLGNRSGRCRTTTFENWGGPHKKGTGVSSLNQMKTLHPSAKAANEESIVNLHKRHGPSNGKMATNSEDVTNEKIVFACGDAGNKDNDQNHGSEQA